MGGLTPERARVGRARPPGALLPSRGLGPRPLVRRGRDPPSSGRYHVLSLDQRGHGASEWAPEGEYATEHFASDLLGVTEALGWQRMALIGHSMGGHNAMALRGVAPGADRSAGRHGQPPVDAGRAPPGHASTGHRGPCATRRSPPRSRASGCCPARPSPTRRCSSTWAARGSPSARGASSTASTPCATANASPSTPGRCSSASPRRPWSCAASTRRSCLARWRRTCSKRLPHARLVEIPGAHHHLVLDAPLPFAQVLDEFLGEARRRPERPGGGAYQTRSRRTAQTLYSGIWTEGSWAELVRKLAADSSSFTKGTNTAPGRTASVSRA